MTITKTLIRYAPSSGLMNYLSKHYDYPIIVPDPANHDCFTRSEYLANREVALNVTKSMMLGSGIIIVGCLNTAHEIEANGFSGHIVYCEFDRINLASISDFDEALHLAEVCRFTSSFTVVDLLNDDVA